MVEQKTVKLTGDQIMNAFGQEKARLESLQRRMASLQALHQEIFFAIDSLKAIKKTKKGEQAMITLGAGIFLDVKIDENTKAKKSLAGNVLVGTKINEIIEELDLRETETSNKIEEMNKQQQAIYANLNSLSQIITKAQQARAEQNK